MTSTTSPTSIGARVASIQNSRGRLLGLHLGCILCVAPLAVRADQVVLRNGDCYYGRVLSLTTNSLVLQSDVLGRVTLPRGRVTQVVFGSPAPTNVVPAAPVTNVPSRSHRTAITNGDPNLSAVLRQLGTQTNLLQQVQSEQLGAAGPEARNKFNELVGGLLTGKLSVEDIRVQAKSAADQLRELKRDLGPEVGEAVDGYLAILDKFLQEMTPATGASPKPKTGPTSK